ncbi:Hypothetical_protein [Hexamita inflata]|uniref:Hypothetical_protein n=1 Tax=Hexamita inflata TaxID=28002 RepID=A0AA86PY13_9EUKA|nr:Hypothetical protein HINF_LOCUS33518 [Hexamita inflata]
MEVPQKTASLRIEYKLQLPFTDGPSQDQFEYQLLTASTQNLCVYCFKNYKTIYYFDVNDITLKNIQFNEEIVSLVQLPGKILVQGTTNCKVMEGDTLKEAQIVDSEIKSSKLPTKIGKQYLIGIQGSNAVFYNEKLHNVEIGVNLKDTTDYQIQGNLLSYKDDENVYQYQITESGAEKLFESQITLQQMKFAYQLPNKILLVELVDRIIYFVLITPQSIQKYKFLNDTNENPLEPSLLLGVESMVSAQQITILLNQSAFYAFEFDLNLTPLYSENDSITASRYIDSFCPTQPVTDIKNGIKANADELCPDMFAINRYFASNFTKPIVKINNFGMKPLQINAKAQEQLIINGETNEDVKKAFNEYSYQYIILTRGFESNAIIVYYASNSFLMRPDRPLAFDYSSFTTMALEQAAGSDAFINGEQEVVDEKIVEPVIENEEKSSDLKLSDMEVDEEYEKQQAEIKQKIAKCQAEEKFISQLKQQQQLQKQKEDQVLFELATGTPLKINKLQANAPVQMTKISTQNLLQHINKDLNIYKLQTLNQPVGTFLMDPKNPKKFVDAVKSSEINGIVINPVCFTQLGVVKNGRIEVMRSGKQFGLMDLGLELEMQHENVYEAE